MNNQKCFELIITDKKKLGLGPTLVKKFGPIHALKDYGIGQISYEMKEIKECVKQKIYWNFLVFRS